MMFLVTTDELGTTTVETAAQVAERTNDPALAEQLRLVVELDREDAEHDPDEFTADLLARLIATSLLPESVRDSIGRRALHRDERQAGVTHEATCTPPSDPCAPCECAAQVVTPGEGSITRPPGVGGSTYFEVAANATAWRATRNETP